MGIKDHLIQRYHAFKSMGHDNPIESFILEHGKEYALGPKSFAKSKMKSGLCYMNAATQVFENHDLTYVEGYASVYGIPIQHAWVIDREGQIIERTMTEEPVDRNLEYFGVEFSTAYLMQAVLKNEYYGLLGGFYNHKTIGLLLAGQADFKPKREDA
jgi:hypothetical protein